jgi:hypothetical protein
MWERSAKATRTPAVQDNNDLTAPAKTVAMSPQRLLALGFSFRKPSTSSSSLAGPPAPAETTPVSREQASRYYGSALCPGRCGRP